MRRTLIRAVEDRGLAARIVATHPVAGLSSGSALLRVGDELWAVHDDAFRVTRISLPSLATSAWVLKDDGRPLPKRDKPDFESAVRTADGTIHLLGSGSAPPRRRIARLHADRSSATFDDRPALYDCVGAALALAGPPNIEGALVEGDRLRLFHRSVGAQPSAIADLSLGSLHDEPPAVLAVAAFDLGTLDGVALSFTDAAGLGGGRCVFVATAEDTPDAVSDGPVAGSVVGLVEARSARWARLVYADGLPSADKVEGIALDDDRRGAWILTDADDPTRPALLGRVELAGF